MATTTHGLPYPIASDAPAGHTQIQALADSVDAQLLTTVTSLPGSPVDGQRCLYLADATNGVVWDLRYRSASASAYKWECVGGAPLMSGVATAVNKSAGAAGDLSGSAGPSITVPLSGDYEIAFGASVFPAASAAGIVYVKFGAAAEDDHDSVRSQFDGAIGNPYRPSMKRTVAASTVVKLTYQAVTGICQFQDRELTFRPVRVG